MDDQGFRFFIYRSFSAVILLAVILLVNALEPGRLSPGLTAVIAVLYLLVNLLLYLMRFRQHYLVLLVLDVVVVTLMIYVTGSHESRFQFLYLILVIYAGFFVRRDQLHLVAAVAVAAYSSTAS